MSRRTLLGAGVGAAATAYVARFVGTPIGSLLDGVATRFVSELPDLSRHPRAGGNAISLVVERDKDLLLLDMAFYQFEVDTSSSPVSLVPTAADNLILVQFPPQAVGEGVYPYPPLHAGAQFDPPPILSVVAGPSELWFQLGTDQTIPLPTMTVDDLLDWSEWTLLVEDVATVGSTSAPTMPAGTTCQIECPYGLYLSPVVNPTVTRIGTETTSYVTSFAGTTQPSTSDGVTECWSATLTYDEVVVVSSIADGSDRTARSIDPRRPHIIGPGGTFPLEPLVSGVWCRDLQIYDDANATDDWVYWKDPTTGAPVLDQSRYWATPVTTQIPTDE